MRIKALLWVVSMLILAQPADVCATTDIENFANEYLTFTIKKLGLKAGVAQLDYHGVKNVDGHDVLHVKFKAGALNFLDEEDIYCSVDNYYPVRVERNINLWGKKEQITEVYDLKGSVNITKYVKDEVKEQTITKDKPLDNIYCFLLRYRLKKLHEQNRDFQLILPTKDLTLKHKKDTTIRAAGEKHEAYYLESTPKKYRLWFAKDKQDNLPLRIDGAVGFGKTSMILRHYAIE